MIYAKPKILQESGEPENQKKVKELTTKLGSARILRDSIKRTLNQKQRILFREIRLAAQRAIVVIADNEGLETKLGI